MCVFFFLPSGIIYINLELQDDEVIGNVLVLLPVADGGTDIDQLYRLSSEFFGGPTGTISCTSCTIYVKNRDPF